MSLTDNTVGEICDSRGKVSVEWAIPNYYSLSHKADTYYESPPFLLSRSTWCIRIYPNGQRCDHSVESIGLYLRKIDDVNINRDVTFTLGIKNPDGTIYDSDTFSYDFESRSMNGWPEWMERRTIFLLKNAIAPQGILTVFCVASVSYGVEVASQTPVDCIDNLCSDFRSLYLAGQKSDVILKVNGKELRAHKVILQARSPVLDAMFQHDWKERSDGIVHITDCDPKTFHEFLLYLYTGQGNMTSDNVTGLYSLADKYQVKELQERCAEFMKENLSMDTVCDIITIADRYQEEELRESAKKLLIRNIKKIVPTEKWKSLMTENSRLAVELLMAVIPEDSS